jgi:hypothetical protein
VTIYPNAISKTTPNFWFRDIWILRIRGIGRVVIKISINTLRTPPPNKGIFGLIQCAEMGSGNVQKALIGLILVSYFVGTNEYVRGVLTGIEMHSLEKIPTILLY